jgi:hypothetical protein
MIPRRICAGMLPLAACLAGCGGRGPSVSTAPVPTVDLSASLNPVPLGQNSTLTWSSQNASSCNASGAWSGSQLTSGSQTISQSAAGTYTYTLTCSGTGGSGSASLAFVASVETITADASKLGVAMNRNQLGVNLNIGYPDDSDASYVPLWTGAGTALFRWPGGLLADYYHWQTHSYGPCAPWPNPPSATAFDTWMKAIVQPMNADVAVTVNYGTNPTCTGPADPNEAAAWVDYANNTQRYGVKYWTVGNEQYLAGEPDLHALAHDPATYASLVATQFYPLMKAKDSTILVGIDLAFGNATYSVSSDTWDPIVLANAKYDFVEMHYYPEHNNQDDDNALLTQWSDQVATNFSTAKSLLAASGHANTPIFLGEFDRDSGGSSGPGHETVSVVDALFTAIVVAEATNAGVNMTAAWMGIDSCWPDGSPPSTAYGWQHYGSWAFFASSGSGFPSSCPDQGAPKGTPFPKARAFQILSQYVVAGETPIAASSSDSSVRAYGATSGNGYALLLINADSTSTHTLPVTLQNTSGQSYNATTISYGKHEYDQSANGVWEGPTSGVIGSVGTTFDVSVPPWSVTLVKLQ